MSNDMLYIQDAHNMCKTCITWTQNVFRYQKVKTNGAKGRLGEKIIIILFVLTTFTFFGQFNIDFQAPQQ
jgi:hypothetical protein